MNVAASAGDSKQPVPTANTFQLISSAEVLRNKVTTILGILSECSDLLVPGERAEFSDPKLKSRYEGGALDAAQATYITACDRLDRLLKDDKNWRVHESDKALGAQVKQLNRVNLEIAEARLERERYFNRPSILANAKFYRRGSLFYVALGDNFTEDSIYGKGPTLEAALDNLDAVLASFKSEKPAVKPKNSHEQ